MKQIIYLLLFLLSHHLFSQHTITTAQKNELINYDYSSYVANQKTIGEFLTNIPYVNTANSSDFEFSTGQIVYLNGLQIYFNCDNEEFIITLFVKKLEHIPNKRYDANNPWDLNLLKLEKIEYIEIQDYTSNEVGGLVRHVE